MKLALLTTAAISALFFVPNNMAQARDNGQNNISNGPQISVLNDKEKRLFSEIYWAIAQEDWKTAEKLIDDAPRGPMANMARAEYYLAPKSPVITAEQLQNLLKSAPYLPKAEQLERLAQKRGVTNLPNRPGIHQLSYLGGAPRRDLPDNINVEGISEIRDQIQINIRNDDPAGAEQIVEANAHMLSDDALAELRYRVSWSYYIENDNENSRRLSNKARMNGGQWGIQANWAYAMASWRLKDYGAAFEGFDLVGRRAANDELRAAGLYWGARTATIIKRPDLVQPRLQQASAFAETFYGLLASEALGSEPPVRQSIAQANFNWGNLKSQENIQIAAGLAEIGQNKLADQALRFQARIGEPGQYDDLVGVAGALNLPSTQYWLGHYGPSRGTDGKAGRYPTPNWQPKNGWRVDPSLIFAHALQESAFQTEVISPAGARGLMQVRPGTARDFANARGEDFTDSYLDDPVVNLEYGQSYIEKLRDMTATGGLLPKVIAAYNAGPSPVSRWNSEIHDNGDPLLYIESIPYWETRGYVTIILRNYWMYEMRNGKSGGSMTGLAQYLWPKFPTENGQSVAVRGSGGYFGGR